MDEEAVAQTLRELEQKLLELEDTLHSIAHGAEPQSRGAAPSPAPLAPAPPPPPPPPAPDTQVRAPAQGPGRIVDETTESRRGPLATPHARTPVEPVPEPGPEPRPQPARRPPPAPQPPAPAGRPPGAAELLRFRERLERAARDLTHDYDELLGRLSYPAMSTSPPRTISFARGVPSLDIIDVQGLRDAAVRAFDSDPEGTTAYGTAVGYPRLRSWIADKHGVEPERVLVTNGSLQADAFLFDQLVHAGDEVIVESPTYDRTLLGLRERGAQLHAVELTREGIDTDALAHLLAQGARPKLAHIIPNFQNPAGYTLSLQRRRDLLALAEAHDFVILEDDPYGELRFTGEDVPTMLSLDGAHVVYASSFTKTVCPGVRVGYLVGPTELIAALTKQATNTYISPNMVSQSLVYEFCASGAIERSIETVKTALAERARTLAGALRSDLADAEFVEPQGGYFMWVTLPEGTDVHALFDAAAQRGVAFVKGTDFLLEGGENTLRLAYSGVTPAEIETGIARLAEAYRSL
jgi:DNA-binding transcriptional MocR family regulator